MKLIEKPNLISLLILGVVVLIAAAYGWATYTQAPELEHYQVDENFVLPFNFDRPAKVVSLGKELREISGLSRWKNNDEVLAVQDEDGDVFVVNTQNGATVDVLKFGKDRDYEGIARRGDTIFVLERDGDIHRIVHQDERKEYDAEKIETDFSYRNDTEGICYDERTNSLLIVPKEQELNPGNNDYRHGIYGFDLARGRLTPQPLFYVDEFAVGQVLYQKQKPRKFKPSGVAVDPLSGNLYIVASVGNLMMVINRESELLHLEVLRRDAFAQPEGITFNARGDLIISSEGRGGKGTITTFTRQPVPTQQDSSVQ